MGRWYNKYKRQHHGVYAAQSMGRVSKGASCEVSGCSERAVRSLPSQRVSKYLSIKTSERRALLCEAHYKEFKKLSKKDRELERARYEA